MAGESGDMSSTGDGQPPIASDWVHVGLPDGAETSGHSSAQAKELSSALTSPNAVQQPQEPKPRTDEHSSPEARCPVNYPRLTSARAVLTITSAAALIYYRAPVIVCALAAAGAAVLLLRDSAGLNQSPPPSDSTTDRSPN